MKPWVKLYTEINRDPKILTLTWPQRGIWAALLAIAGEIDDRDEQGLETGMLDSTEYAAIRIRCDLAEFQEAVTAFAERGMIEEQDGILVLPHYGKRQAVPPSETREAQRDRQRKHRESQHITAASRPVTPSDPDPDPDPEAEAENIDGADAPPSGDGPPIKPFQNWLDAIQSSSNRPAEAVAMYTALYPGRDPPDYGRVGQTAKRIGGWALLARYLWLECTRPPVGCVLDYIEARHKAGGYRSNGSGADDSRVHPYDRQVGPVIHR